MAYCGLVIRLVKVVVVIIKDVAAPVIVSGIFVSPETPYLTCVAAHNIVAVLVVAAVAVVAVALFNPLDIVHCRGERSARHFLGDKVHVSVRVNAACCIIIVFAVRSLLADKYDFGSAYFDLNAVLEVADALTVFDYKRRMLKADNIVTALYCKHRYIGVSVLFELNVIILRADGLLISLFVGIAYLEMPACRTCGLAFRVRIKRKALGNDRNVRCQKVVREV